MDLSKPQNPNENSPCHSFSHFSDNTQPGANACAAEIVRGKRGITADTSLRLAAYFGNSAEFWMGLQTDYDLEVADDDSGERIREDVRPREAA